MVYALTNRVATTSGLENRGDKAAEQYQLGMTCVLDGEYQRAIVHFTAALKHDPLNEVFYQRGVVHAKKRNYAAAIADFSRVLDRNPSHIAACFERANAHFSRKDYVQAIHDYTEVLLHHPTHVSAYANRGHAYRRLGELSKAIADFTAALRLDAAGAQSYYQRGLLYRAQRDFLRAEADLQETIRLQPVHWAALYHHAKVLLAQGRLSEALADLNEVLRLRPRLVAAYLSRALIHDRLSRFEEARADSTYALNLEANNPAACLVRGVVHVHREDYGAAIEDLTQAIQFDAHVPLAHFERGLAYAWKGDYGRALDDCNLVIATEPGNAQAYACRSIVYHFQGDVENALADYARALGIDPRSVMTGLSPSLADSARDRTTQRMADYIDGLLPERTGAGTNKTSPPRRSQQARETMVASADSTVIHAESTDADDVVEGLVEELLKSPPEPGSRLESRQATKSAVKPGEPVPAGPAPASSNAATCPLCNRSGPPAETLPGGRVRCANCDSLFLPAPSAPPSPANSTTEYKRVRTPSKKQAVADAETSFMKKWQRPIRMAVASLAVLVVLYLCFPRNIFGTTSRLAVYPAQGTVRYLGEAIPNAAIFLHPMGVKADFPLPRAIVKDDGSFIVGTYGLEDGAPAGEYRVTVQWFQKVEDPEKDDGVTPRNQLPAKFARAETSGLSLRIQEGENKFPPLQLMH